MNLLRRNTHILFLLFLFFLSLLVTWPVGEFPLNDDWAYAKALLVSKQDGSFTIGDWPAMTLATHLLWGKLFTLPAGISFTALRLSTIASSLIGLLVLFRITRSLSGSPVLATVAALTLLFNPLHYNLTYTFMTDVNFNTLLILGVHCLIKYYESPNLLKLFPLLLISVALTLLRQFGIIFPVALLASAFCLKPLNKLALSGAILIVVLTGISLWIYEGLLKGILSGWASYKFITGGEGLKLGPLLYQVDQRWATSVLLPLMYAAPLSLPAFAAYLRRSPARWRLPVVVCSLVVSWLMFNESDPLPGNVFRNFSLGAETFFEDERSDGLRALTGHTFSHPFDSVMGFLKVLLPAAAIGLILLSLVYLLRGSPSEDSASQNLNRRPLYVFLTLSIAAYFVSLMYSNSYFDRYHIPLITLTVMLVSLKNYGPIKFAYALVPLLFFTWISVAGTRDYFEMNRQKWQAYNRLKSEGVTDEQINAGFEINCWNSGKKNWWTDFTVLNGYTHLVQYSTEPGFTTKRNYFFRRWLTGQQDTIRVMQRAH
jgi:hypothetical protein